MLAQERTRPGVKDPIRRLEDSPPPFPEGKEQNAPPPSPSGKGTEPPAPREREAGPQSSSPSGAAPAGRAGSGEQDVLGVAAQEVLARLAAMAVADDDQVGLLLGRPGRPGPVPGLAAYQFAASDRHLLRLQTGLRFVESLARQLRHLVETGASLPPHMERTTRKPGPRSLASWTARSRATRPLAEGYSRERWYGVPWPRFYAPASPSAGADGPDSPGYPSHRLGCGVAGSRPGQGPPGMSARLWREERLDHHRRAQAPPDRGFRYFAAQQTHWSRLDPGSRNRSPDHPPGRAGDHPQRPRLDPGVPRGSRGLGLHPHRSPGRGAHQHRTGRARLGRHRHRRCRRGPGRLACPEGARTGRRGRRRSPALSSACRRRCWPGSALVPGQHRRGLRPQLPQHPPAGRVLPRFVNGAKNTLILSRARRRASACSSA